MNCHIIKDKSTGEEILIPGCDGVVNHFHLDMPDRKLIKEYCCCIWVKREKYDTKTRDQVFTIINELQGEILKAKNHLGKLEEHLDGLKSEVFMLNTETVFESK
jgi:hypothetical protein